MLQINSLIDMPVIVNGGKERKLGTVTDLLFDKDTMKIAAFVVTAGGIIPVKKYLPYTKNVVIDNDCIRIESKACSRELARRDCRAAASYRQDLQWHRVIQNGNRLGRISNAAFGAEAGEIVRLEVSDGFAQDILKGRESVTLGKNVSFQEKDVLLTDTKGEH